ncbi:MAG: hypothetical protein GQ582_03255 [Methyloprofundus sp.]|nr:hypothetical protein [Methyloprofundus sp.]
MLKNVLLFISLSLLNVSTVKACPSPQECVSTPFENQAALKLGQQVLALSHVLQNPQQENALQAVTELGHDQRYYIMVRGWLTYQLQADLSIANAAQEQTSEQITARIRFLKKAIRAIDLE